jgi:release factor glutamine methyltransferase
MRVGRAFIAAHPEQRLTRAEADLFDRLSAARRMGVPVAYLIGGREFYGRYFEVDRRVLIPRPESELLIDLILSKVPGSQGMRLADLGTGSGILAVTLACERRGWDVLAVDVSPDALAVASSNRARHAARNVHLVASDWWRAISRDARFDAILSNPPYVAGTDQHLSEGDLRFEPKLALTDAADGLQALRKVIAGAGERLAANGVLAVEHGHDQATAVAAMFSAAGLRDIALVCDLAGLPRVTHGRKSCAGKD